MKERTRTNKGTNGRWENSKKTHHHLFLATQPNQTANSNNTTTQQRNTGKKMNNHHICTWNGFSRWGCGNDGYFCGPLVSSDETEEYSGNDNFASSFWGGRHGCVICLPDRPWMLVNESWIHEAKQLQLFNNSIDTDFGFYSIVFVCVYTCCFNHSLIAMVLLSFFASLCPTNVSLLLNKVSCCHPNELYLSTFLSVVANICCFIMFDLHCASVNEVGGSCQCCAGVMMQLFHPWGCTGQFGSVCWWLFQRNSCVL